MIGYQRYRRQNNNNRRGNFRNQNYDRNRSRSYEVDDRSISYSRSRSGSRATMNKDRIRCFHCREYDHFTRGCLKTQANREAEEVQQVFNMNEDQTILQASLMDVDHDGQTINSVELGLI